jgi:hypothetical protein
MFGVFAWLRKVAVGGFEHGILVPMPQLSLHRRITGLSALVLFYGSFFAVLILEIGHE